MNNYFITFLFLVFVSVNMNGQTINSDQLHYKWTKASYQNGRVVVDCDEFAFILIDEYGKLMEDDYGVDLNFNTMRGYTDDESVYKIKKFTGQMIHYKDGIIKNKREYIGGIENGKFTRYYSDGDISEEGIFKNGYEVGIWKTYSEPNKISSITTWSDEGYILKKTAYYPDGSISYSREFIRREKGPKADGCDDPLEDDYFYYKAIGGGGTSSIMKSCRNAANFY